MFNVEYYEGLYFFQIIKEQKGTNSIIAFYKRIYLLMETHTKKRNVLFNVPLKDSLLYTDTN